MKHEEITDIKNRQQSGLVVPNDKSLTHSDGKKHDPPRLQTAVIYHLNYIQLVENLYMYNDNCVAHLFAL